MTDASTLAPTIPAATRLTARALALGERLDAGGLERSDMLSSTPLAFKTGHAGFVALYRFGVAVLVGLSPIEEDDFLRQVKARVSGERERIDDETVILQAAEDGEDRVTPGGPILLKDFSPERLLVVADVLSKTVSLGRDEREVTAVLDVIEPFAAVLSRTGRPPSPRRTMLKLIGQALLVQHRLSGRVAVEEKPDVLWDRHDLERLYARLEDEYELKERTRTLQRKLDVIVETARALTDVIEADRATRLEFTIVLLIVAEIALTLVQMVVFRR